MRVSVEVPGRPYEVIVEPGARAHLARLIAERAPEARRAVILASAEIQSQPWFDLDAGVDVEVVTIPDGESAKTMSTVEEICGALSDLGLSRRDVIVGVGGGAATDLAGFVAAVYLRGVAVAHVATSLVAQVDAAIGGKTGVNLPVGKNLIGAFHQPIGVLCDVSTLATLPSRERLSGLGEVAKCWLLESRDADQLRASDESTWVSVAVGLKAAIVGADEREGGPRALLNYGHTLAHALEAQALSGRRVDLRHGEAVAIGLAFASRLARRLGRVGDETVATHEAVLDELGLPRRLPRGLVREDVIGAMSRDKKAHHALTFVLAGSTGYSVVEGVDPMAVRATYDEMEVEP